MLNESKCQFNLSVSLQTSFHSQSYLPLGNQEYNYVVNIKIFVEDQLGTSTLALNEYVNVVR